MFFRIKNILSRQYVKEKKNYDKLIFILAGKIVGKWFYYILQKFCKKKKFKKNLKIHES